MLHSQKILHFFNNITFIVHQSLSVNFVSVKKIMKLIVYLNLLIN